MKLIYTLLTLLAVSISSNASSVYSQGDCYISDPAWAAPKTFRTKCSLDFYSQLGETTVVVKIGQDGYELYNYDQRLNGYDENLRKNGKHVIKIDDDPAYIFYRNFYNLTITDEYDEDAMTCFKSEYAEVCYKEDATAYSQGDYLYVYPEEDEPNDDIFHP